MRRGSVTLWAWLASIAVHLVVLAVFGVVKFSGSQADDGQRRRRPTARVKQMERLMQASPIAVKPKIKRPDEDPPAARTERILPTRRAFEPARQLSKVLPVFRNRSGEADSLLPGRGGIEARGIEFFGNWTNERKMCYVVDSSGSMGGIFRRVCRKLKDSIAALEADQYFCVIFFGGDRLFEFKDRLVRASEKNKLAAYDFIDAVSPAGRTNALLALERAARIRDSSGVCPNVIYFLTDGFELAGEDEGFSQQISRFLKRFAPATKINTVGFWPQSEDRRMLETISRQSRGESVFITE